MSLAFRDFDCNCNQPAQSTEPPSQPPANSYAYYPFNGNTNDVSGNGHHGMPVGNPVLTHDRFGRRDSAYQLNGIDQYIILPAFGISSDLSVSFWIKTTASDPNTFPSGTFIVDRDVGGLTRDWSVCLGSGAQIQFNTGTTSSENIVSSDSSVNNDARNHVVVVRNTSLSWKGIYINGTLNKSGGFDNGSFTNSSASICIGACGIAPAAHHCYNGLIDDVRIFSRALTASEINTLYHEGGW